MVNTRTGAGEDVDSDASTAASISQSEVTLNSNLVSPTPAHAITMATNKFKLPSFLPQDIALWYQLVETQFKVNKITNNEEKLAAITAELEAGTLMQASDILKADTTPEITYAQLRERLIHLHSVSDEKRLYDLLKGIEMGNSKPSSLLREMRIKAGGLGTTDAILKTLWFNRLPVRYKEILTVSSDTLDNLALLADKLHEVQESLITTPTVHQISTPQTITASAHSPFELIQQQLAVLTSRIDAMQDRTHQHFRSRSRSRRNNRTRDVTPPENKENSDPDALCFFHKKFGDKAYKCRYPCKHFKEGKSTSGNGEGQH